MAAITRRVLRTVPPMGGARFVRTSRRLVCLIYRNIEIGAWSNVDFDRLAHCLLHSGGIHVNILGRVINALSSRDSVAFASRERPRQKDQLGEPVRLRSGVPRLTQILCV
jgi:hypothetical protein